MTHGDRFPDGRGARPGPAPSPAPGDAPPPPAPLQDARILVRKKAGRLELYDGGRLVKACAAITGRNPADKEREGDEATPEGDFYVCVKNPRSRFHLSLGLSYPNLEDAARGLEAGWIDPAQGEAIAAAIARRAPPPWNTPLGGEIMIHGFKGDRAGTSGCVALDNRDIEEIYALVPVGTPVRIDP